VALWLQEEDIYVARLRPLIQVKIFTCSLIFERFLPEPEPGCNFQIQLVFTKFFFTLIIKHFLELASEGLQSSVLLRILTES
jgi:hypothetical protein